MLSISTIAQNKETFLKFRFKSGFSEGQRPSTFDPAARVDAPEVDETSKPTNLNFKGWTNKTGSGDRKRVMKAFSTFCDTVGGVPIVSGMSEVEGSSDTMDMVLEVSDFGMVYGAFDLMLRHPMTNRSSPVHAGPTMFDDVFLAVDFVKDRPEEQKDMDVAISSLFVKAVMCTLLRERPVPVFLSDLSSFAMRALVSKSCRGCPIVSFEVLSFTEFELELKRWQDKTGTHRVKVSPPSCIESVKRLLKLEECGKRILENGTREVIAHVHEVPTPKNVKSPVTASPRAAKSKAKKPSTLEEAPSPIKKQKIEETAASFSDSD